MSVEQPPGLHAGPSRLPSTKSVTPKITELSRSDQIEVLRDILLTADDGTERRILHKVAQFIEKYPQRAKLPVTTNGDLRARYVEFIERTWEAKDYVSGHFDTTEISELQPDRAMCWADAMCLTLRRYVSATETELHFGHDDGSTFTVEASNRWKPEYQEEQLAKMHGWLRQAAGGDYEHVENVPDGIEVPGEYDNPKLVLLTRSASSKPDATRLVPGEHEADMASSWSVVYDGIRNAVRSFDAADWSYDARSEPHPGGGHGINACYGHEHVVVVVDADAPTHEIRAEMRRPVEAHVRATPTAGPDAHDLDKPEEAWADPAADIGTVEVFDLDDDECPIENVAGYVGAYASLDADDGLLDRPTEYVAWAAAKDALNTRTMRRSEASVEMAKADLETIQGHSPECHAVRDVGESPDETSTDDSTESEATQCNVGYASDWGGKAGRIGKPPVHDQLADRIRSLDADADASVSDITALLRESGWDMSVATVEVAFGAGDRIREVADRMAEPTMPKVCGKVMGAASPATVRRVLDGFTVDAQLAEHIRAEFDRATDAEVVADELQTRSMQATTDRVGAVLDRESYNYDKEQTDPPDNSGWSLDAITRGVGTADAEREEVGARSKVEMVEVETDRDEYADMWLVPPSHIDDPADLVEDADRTVRWRYRNGVGVRGEVTGDYIRDQWGDVPAREWWDYVQPHEAGEPDPFSESGAIRQTARS